jgi:hypothetical protein
MFDNFLIFNGTIKASDQNREWGILNADPNAKGRFELACTVKMQLIFKSKKTR